MTRDATLIDRDGHPTLRFERRLGVPIERAWHAVTDADEMRAWFPSAVVGERRVGAPLAFPFDENVADTFEGEVTEWIPTSVFAFTWNGDQLRIELASDGDGTTLVFTQSIGHMTEAARTGSGWHSCLDSLDAHLGGRPADPDTWKEVYPRYLERMGPPLATIGRDYSLTFERTHHVSPERLWECLTDPTELSAWMGFAVRVEPGLGGRFTVDMGPDGEDVHRVITEWDPPRRLTYTFEGGSLVEWTITATEHGCRYVLRQTGINGDHAASFGSGWHGMLLQLDMYAAAGQLVPDDGYEARLPRYQALLD